MYCRSMIRPEVSVTVCRDCCCGSAVKHPDVDHDGALARLREAVDATGRGVVRVVKCLDECERSDVVLVRRRLPSGTETIWLGWVNDDTAVMMLAEWLRTGAVGPLPDALALHVFTKRPPRPPIAVRYARGEEDSLVCPALRPALANASAPLDPPLDPPAEPDANPTTA